MIGDITLDAKQVKTGYVFTEGDQLYYEVRGQGEPLLMIPGGGGDGRIYTFAADILAHDYKVITYDRRGNARSSGNLPQNFEVSQECRDAVAVIQATGESSAHIFGNSSGGIIALDIAKNHPEAVRTVVVHEPPAVRVLPDGVKWQGYFASLYWMSHRFGVGIAMLRFAMMLGWPLFRAMIGAKIPHDSPQSENDNNAFFMHQELLPVTNYLPDVEAIKNNGVNIVMAVGKWTLDHKKVYGRTVPILADMLDCEMVIFPGHHVSYIDIPEAWTAVLRNILMKG